ncbi:YlbD family protein [Ectobacillus antri]|jgi:hypothetical protein|uniref:YlbD family protein n=1 Tax=Ectobacillus antri TaxID=2486280 RepID=A0ABT6H0A2_9BACI|nr:YlbD family protein [Ectobacillus antri]MDG4655809.1 YlbD family protein [Ectobacillus antri]MDG5752484.1 YlbD family protein [Ectobacillus antri]
MTTANKRSHPSVQKFKEFVRNHPKMIYEVRNGSKTWQQFYEEWYLLGENDPIWQVYKQDGEQESVAAAQESVVAAGVMGQVMSFIKNINMDQVQYHLNNVTSTIGSVQQVIQQFKGSASDQNSTPQQNNPFFFQKD